MPWFLTDDSDMFADRVWPLLAQDPVLHTLPLTVIETLRTGYRWSTDPVVFGWYAAGLPPGKLPSGELSSGEPPSGEPPSGEPPSGEPPAAPVTGVVGMTPPFDLLLPEVPAGAMGSLVDALRDACVRVPGVRGRPELVADFSARWRSETAVVVTGGERERLYRLDGLTPPSGVEGEARRATVEDIDLVTEYWVAFSTESGLRRANAGSLVRGRVEAGLVWLWERDGDVVSMAARNAIAAQVARVGPVYTPPANRRCGYAAAVTSACSQDALDSGASDVVLFTDLANPTANSVYQSIGYRAVSDFETISFG